MTLIKFKKRRSPLRKEHVGKKEGEKNVAQKKKDDDVDLLLTGFCN